MAILSSPTLTRHLVMRDVRPAGAQFHGVGIGRIRRRENMVTVVLMTTFSQSTGTRWKLGEFCKVTSRTSTFWQPDRTIMRGRRTVSLAPVFFAARTGSHHRAPAPSMMPAPVMATFVGNFCHSRRPECHDSHPENPPDSSRACKIASASSCKWCGCAGKSACSNKFPAAIPPRRRPPMPPSSSAAWMAAVSSVLPSPVAPNLRTLNKFVWAWPGGVNPAKPAAKASTTNNFMSKFFGSRPQKPKLLPVAFPPAKGEASSKRQ